MTSTGHPPASRPEPLEREDFTDFLTIPTRWMDVGIYGHVNNVQYFSYFDTAVNRWYVENGILEPANSQQIFLVVETGCHYFSELTFPDDISAGLKIEKIGSSSVIFRIGLFSGKSSITAAHGRFAHVHVDRISRRPVPISERKRAILSRLTL
ncbi:acyl-CoA thioesterase [Roseibium marinum]|uniref:Acyl-CoA thioester hydrolase n=1 Tax=Roseibium marinum TaxID=281252 RepID=A0A2S3UMN6_9HYPH|nr:thioesterase family protein [Roseibium marinum]POF28988.1 acyl-CoA thioester hydrolase [Roseibium marinum]